MKIAALIVTRGKPQQVVGIIESMRMLATGDHELEFLVACDDDVPTTAVVLNDYFRRDMSVPALNASIDEKPRPIGVGSCWNRLAKLTDADALITLPDDGIIATPRWDHCISWAWRNHDWVHPDLKIGGLKDQANPGQPTLFVMGKRWVELVGEVLDARYPFWFSDTAIAETYSFITGSGLPMLPIEFASKGGKWNPRLRRMSLWWAHYGITRRERVWRAGLIRNELGLPMPSNLEELCNLWCKRDADGLPASEEIVRQIEKPAPLDERYLEAERAAIEYINARIGPAAFRPSTADGDRF
jgi:hypothetical protein